ncbi:helix-turn-helix domain-containing protein [Nostoc sp. DedQUE09]|uniref:winged helix-turn-helix transcriptional regulator n=1 Tax=Nostoc sp. DedQUE09 TaxID=3075394 RepID=UPI002AD3157A|nr:helix-turn-helix domain-containing protein [Nostoc sp. DedQUE09]MDZ7950510.1 helix-turn-helix domain-containing protein [Nostoc sp. DedQUE09]
MALNPDSNDSQLTYLPQPALERIAKMNLFDTRCAAHQMLEIIANKWTVLIVYALTQGKKRYGQLKQQIVGVSPKMLIQSLRNLERYGLVEREVYLSVPPRVEYSLTPLGASLVEPLAILERH